MVRLNLVRPPLPHSTGKPVACNREKSAHRVALTTFAGNVCLDDDIGLRVRLRTGLTLSACLTRAVIEQGTGTHPLVRS